LYHDAGQFRFFGYKNSFFFVGCFVAQKACSKKIVLFGGMGWERISGIFADSAGFFGGIDLIAVA